MDREKLFDLNLIDRIERYSRYFRIFVRYAKPQESDR